MKKQSVSNVCPCGSDLIYGQCCGQWHSGKIAPDAKTLMRSRYSAYVLILEDYLLATWHPSTRPMTLHLGENVEQKWLGLSIKQYKLIDGNNAIVEFVARYRLGGGKAERLHEVSHFVFENDQWFYVNGEFPGMVVNQ